MTQPDNDLDAPIQGFDDLVRLFQEGGKAKEAFRIGPEMEKFGVARDTLKPIPYDGRAGVLAIFQALAGRDGWKPEGEKEGGPTLALSRKGAQITLEPGGQLELSGTAANTVHEVCSEFRAHLRELAPVSRDLGIVWLGLGFHPFARREDFTWVPKSRYPVMREYLPTRGRHGLDMMLRTSTVQANYDFVDEADAMRKMRVALALAPLTTAMFANSPWYEGKPHGGLTYRGRVWLDVDPDRTGLLPTLWKKGAGFHDYVDWALDAPMFLFKRGTDVVANTGQTFRSFWKNGFQGYRATHTDWQTHLNTLFPEVRLKRTIEIRGADAQTLPTRCALPALWTGIFYDERALADAEALTAPWTYDEVAQLRQHAWETGLRTPFRGEPLVKHAERVLEIAEGGLERRARKNSRGVDERVHLAKLKGLVTKGQSPADAILEAVRGATDFARTVVEKAELKET